MHLALADLVSWQNALMVAITTIVNADGPFHLLVLAFTGQCLDVCVLISMLSGIVKCNVVPLMGGWDPYGDKKVM